MAKQKDLVLLLQRALPRFASDIDHRMRALREGDQALLPTGGRGPHAPELTAADAAYILIAALSLERPKDGNVLAETIVMADIANQEPEIFVSPGVVEPSREAQGEPIYRGDRGTIKVQASLTFHEALTNLLTEECSPPPLYVQLHPLSRGAIICFRHEWYHESDPYGEGKKVFFGQTASHSRPVGVIFEISAVLINQVKSLLLPSPADEPHDKDGGISA